MAKIRVLDFDRLEKELNNNYSLMPKPNGKVLGISKLALHQILDSLSIPILDELKPLKPHKWWTPEEMQHTAKVVGHNSYRKSLIEKVEKIQ